jgi:predicted PurR-regulated permease PerM
MLSQAERPAEQARETVNDVRPTKSSNKTQTFFVGGLFVLAILYTLYLSADFLLPVFLAAFVGLLLAPVVKLLRYLRIPVFIGSAIALAATLVFLFGLATIVSEPLANFLQSVPTYVNLAQSSVNTLFGPLQQLAQTSQSVNKLIEPGNASQIVVGLKQEGLLQYLFTQTPGMLSKVVVVIVLSYFLLVYGQTFLRKVVYVAPRFEDKRRAVEIAHEIQWTISRYLISVSLLNFGLGIVVGTIAGLTGIGNPWVWGGVAFFLNYIPFLGAACGILATLVAGFIHSPYSLYAVLPATSYLAASVLESNLITPHVLGRWMTVNPVAIFVSFLFWGWIWGIPGMLLAVPILGILKIFCSKLPKLNPIAEFLGD